MPLLGEVSARAFLSSHHLRWLQAYLPYGAAALAAPEHWLISNFAARVIKTLHISILK